uniref:Adenine nucleotide translocase lysine methyltransferase n=1 Tax=Canis lupus familiaris TaxID=9615 RepID=A0A8C0RJ43_CANLF
MRDTERQKHRQREKQAPRKEPDAGLDPRSPGSGPEPKANAQPLSHPGVPPSRFSVGDIWRYYPALGSRPGQRKPGDEKMAQAMCVSLLDQALVPYVGASARQVEHVLTLLRGRPGKTVDLGSGDGRIVLAAHRCGLRPALGYELNPWLVGLARLHAWRAGCAGSVRFCCQDLWKVNLRDCHNVSVFLAPSVVGRGAGAAARPRGGPGQPRSTGRTWVGGRSPPVLCTLPPALSHSSRCWKTSCRQSCPKGPEWCRGAFLSPLGSLWPCWVRVWTASGPMTSIVVAQLVRSPQDPVLPQSLGPPLLWLADYLDTIKTQRTTS